jgi:translation initiation factor 2B subunit (eIF-2B alpha/beta/delta family)
LSISIKDLKDDTFSGSFEISQNALYILLDFIEKSKTSNAEKLVDECNVLGKNIIKSQPNMVNIRRKISTVIYHMKRLLKSNKSAEDIKKTSKSKILELIKVAESKKKKIGNIGAKLIFNHSKILTISSSSLIKEIIYSAHQLKRKFSVYCLESRPNNEGHALAYELSKKGIPCVLTTDAMMGQLLSEVNMVISGADRVYESGFVNKSGTLPLAITSKIFQVPFFVAAETDKILKEIDRSLRFYPQDPNEIYTKNNSNLTISNFYFEAITFDYVTKIICEDGVFDTDEYISWYLKD